MKKTYLIFSLFITSISFSQTYDLLETFNGTGYDGGFGGASAEYVQDPLGSDQVLKITSSSASTAANWQGIDVLLTKAFKLTADTQLTMELDVYSTTAITIAPKAQEGIGTAPPSVTYIDYTGSGWETLTLTFNKSLDGKVPANGIYKDFALHVNWDSSTNSFGAPDGRVFYIKNLKGLIGIPPADPAPTDAPVIPPTRNSADVISLFSDAYTDISISEWGTTWDSASITNETFAGNNVKKVSFSSSDNATFVVADFTDNRINTSGFTHFHIDIWTETATLDKSFNHKFSNHANEQPNETSAVEFSTTNASNPALPDPNPGGWISYDIPLSSLTIAGGGSADRDKIGQYIITSNLGVVYIDNIYFYKDTPASIENNDLLGFSMFPNPVSNKLKISAQEAISSVNVFDVSGRKVKSFTINNTNTTLDISDLSEGVYLIKYKSAGKAGAAKFIKQ
jgi:hypothetical protein